MSLNKSVPQPVNKPASHLKAASETDYAGLVRFLIQPFLESPNSLSLDCEVNANTARVWIRVAFESEDKGRVFGRGGRNIQAIRTVIAAAAAAGGHSVYLDIYGGNGASTTDSDSEQEGSADPTMPGQQRRNGSKPTAKPRLRSSSQ